MLNLKKNHGKLNKLLTVFNHRFCIVKDLYEFLFWNVLTYKLYALFNILDQLLEGIHITLYDCIN